MVAETETRAYKLNCLAGLAEDNILYNLRRRTEPNWSHPAFQKFSKLANKTEKEIFWRRVWEKIVADGKIYKGAARLAALKKIEQIAFGKPLTANQRTVRTPQTRLKKSFWQRELRRTKEGNLKYLRYQKKFWQSERGKMLAKRADEIRSCSYHTLAEILRKEGVRRPDLFIKGARIVARKRR